MRSSTAKMLLAALLAVVLVVAGVVAYRGVQDRRRADALDAAAAGLAEALRTGQAAPDAVAGAPDLKPLIADASDVPHRVEVVSTSASGEVGSARLRHTWTLRQGTPDYAYEVDATFTERDGRWTTPWRPELLAPGVQEGDRLRALRTRAPRADILDQAGAPIVTTRAVRRVGIDRGSVAKDVAVASARQLATALGLDVQPYVDAVAAAGDQAFVAAITLRDPSPELATAQALRLPGLLLVPDSMPLAPTAAFARPILGTVGEATKEVIDASGGRLTVGDSAGIGGLQAAMDASLAGKAGESLQVVPASGAHPRVLAAAAPTPGEPVRLTLDIATQTTAESVLAGVGPAAALVAIRPSDGHLLAVASGPGGKGMSTATLGEYPPGSTMKVVTSLALLRAGLTPTTPVSCPATLVIDGRTFKNYDGYPAAKLGDITLRTAFAQSCNTAFMGQRAKLADGALAEAAAGLGMTAEPALGVPAVLGTVPAATGDTEDTQRAASLIGQGKVVSSPLGMAVVAASIAAAHPVRPVLVTSGASGTGAAGTGAASAAGASTAAGTSGASAASPTSNAPSGPSGPTASTSPPPPAKPVTAAEAAALRELMRAVVTEGNSTFLADVPGAPVAAKSGTAEYGDATPQRTHAWMIAIQGDLAVAAFVEDAAGGASDAGPIVTSFLTRLATRS